MIMSYNLLLIIAINVNISHYNSHILREIEYIGDSGSYDDVEFIADDSWLHLLNVPMG